MTGYILLSFSAVFSASIVALAAAQGGLAPMDAIRASTPDAYQRGGSLEESIIQPRAQNSGGSQRINRALRNYEFAPRKRPAAVYSYGPQVQQAFPDARLGSGLRPFPINATNNGYGRGQPIEGFPALADRRFGSAMQSTQTGNQYAGSPYTSPLRAPSINPERSSQPDSRIKGQYSPHGQGSATYRSGYGQLPSNCAAGYGRPFGPDQGHGYDAPKYAIYEESDDEWEQYKSVYGKVYYSAKEENFRRDIWQEHCKKINLHNLKFGLGEVSYTMGMNSHGDLTFKEILGLRTGFQRKVGGIRGTAGSGGPPNSTSDGAGAPTNSRNATGSSGYSSNGIDYGSVDWRASGCVNRIKDQGQCGSCWAFSTIGSLESHWCLKTGYLVSFSEQNLVDCSGEGNDGCNGGMMEPAFDYIRQNGIETEADYPYTAADNHCHHDPARNAARVSGYVEIPEGDEIALTSAIKYVGPISVAIDASLDSFLFYSSGVYNDRNCNSTLSGLNHAVVAIGYGTDAAGGDYYLLKNSWGTTWGQWKIYVSEKLQASWFFVRVNDESDSEGSGFMWMARNRNNQCGITLDASYPIVGDPPRTVY